MIKTLDYIKTIISLYRHREEKENIAIEKLQAAYDSIWEDNRIHNLWYALTDEEIQLMGMLLPKWIFEDLKYYLFEVCAIEFSNKESNKYNIVITINWEKKEYILEKDNDELFYKYLSEFYWI